MNDYRVQHGGTHDWNAGETMFPPRAPFLRKGGLGYGRAKPGSAREVPAPIRRLDV
jgi:hypothetical protein